MSQLIRWRHAGARLVVLWYDDAAGRTQSTEVDGITLERIEGEPLAGRVDGQLVDDLTRLQRGREPFYYQGVAC